MKTSTLSFTLTEARGARARSRACLGRILPGVTALALLLAAPDARAQSWRQDTTLSGETNDALTVDGLGLTSGPTTQASANFQLNIPAGSTIVSASLFTVIRFRRDLLSAALPGNLRLAGVSILNDGAPNIGAPGVIAAARCYDAMLCMYTHRFEVTSIVQSAYAASATLPSFPVALQETGDSSPTAMGTGELFSFSGHTLVVRYRNTRIMARKRFFGVWWGAADQTAEALSAMGAMVPESAVCPAAPAPVPARAEGVTFSASIAGLENACGEDNLLLFQRGAGRLISMGGVGGADDGVMAPLPNCANLGRLVDFRAQYTAGSFGGATGAGTSASDLLTGAPVELDGDFLFREPSAPRMSDELYTLTEAPTTVQFVRNAMNGPPKLLSVAVMQYPPLSADSDGDGHTDIAEGICARIDTDRDSNAREDWDDTDSDNDCIADALESPADRVVRATVEASDRACAMSAPATPFCQFISGGCQSCSISCTTNTNGHLCTRLGTGALGCGCLSDTDCAMGTTCDPNARQCVRAQADAGADVVREASVDAASDGATVMMEAGADASDRDGSSSSDGATADDGGDGAASSGDASSASDGAVVGPAPGITGGACDCRAGVGHTRATSGAWGAVALMAAAVGAAVGRRRRQAASG